MNNICAPMIKFSTDGAISFPSSIPILPHGHSPGGILEQIVPVGRGLLPVRLRDFSLVQQEGMACTMT